MKATINQITNDSIYRGEDKSFAIYFYNEITFEPVDLSAYDEIIFCLKNEDTTSLEITGSTVNLAIGKSDFSVSAAESALLGIGSNTFQVKFNVTTGPTVDIEVFTNTITVKDPVC